MIFDELISAVQTGNWEVDCHEVTLSQNTATAPSTFTGPGHIRQEKDGRLTYKCYPASVHNYVPMSEFGRFGPAGTLVGAERYHTLIAKTFSGHGWTARRTMVDVGGLLESDGVRTLVSGEVHELECVETCSGLEPTYTKIILVFFGDIKFPCNAVTETKTTIAGQDHSGGSSLNVALFRTMGCDFRIRDQNNAMIVEIDTYVPLPAFFDLRVLLQELIPHVRTKANLATRQAT